MENTTELFTLSTETFLLFSITQKSYFWWIAAPSTVHWNISKRTVTIHCCRSSKLISGALSKDILCIHGILSLLLVPLLHTNIPKINHRKVNTFERVMHDLHDPVSVSLRMNADKKSVVGSCWTRRRTKIRILHKIPLHFFTFSISYFSIWMFLMDKMHIRM